MKVEDVILKSRNLILKSKNPIVFFDQDTDGSCSYIQLRKTFSNIKEGYPLSKNDDSQDECLEKIYDNHDLIIFVDTPYLKKEFFETVGKRDCIWVDHHPRAGEMQEIRKSFSDNIIVLNPLDFDSKDGRCTSYQIYRICDKKKNLVYCALACVSDFYLFDILIDLYNYDSKLFSLVFKISEEKRLELFDFINKYDFRDDTVYDERANWIQYLSYDCGSILYKNFFDLLYKFSDSRDSTRLLRKISKLDFIDFKVELNNSKDELFERFNTIYDEYKQVYKKVFKSLSKGEWKKSGIVFVEHSNCIKSFNRQLSEELAYRLEDWRVICSCYQKDNYDSVSCSLRSRGVNVNELLQNALSGLDGRGGGHDFACGASISKKDFNEFKKRLNAGV